MLIDKVTITIQGGNGGNGAVSFMRSEGNPKGGPDGGNGGNGGDVYFVGINDLTALDKFQYKKVWKAGDGVPGKKKNLFGKNAPDLVIRIPLGTRILAEDGNEITEITVAEKPYLIANGGKGGRGNNEFKSATNQTPRFAEKGEEGEKKLLTLELRLIAQIGLIGLPNAGKSTLLSVLTNAKPKIGDYPFTTLEPNVGMMEGIMLADIPGLIEGASEGKGLGTTFLKHIEKTQLLVHCIDVQTADPLKGYQTVRQEFEAYNPELLEKPEIIVLTKIDQVDAEEAKAKVAALTETKRTVYPSTILDENALATFQTKLVQAYKKYQTETRF